MFKLISTDGTKIPVNVSGLCTKVLELITDDLAAEEFAGIVELICGGHSYGYRIVCNDLVIVSDVDITLYRTDGSVVRTATITPQTTDTVGQLKYVMVSTEEATCPLYERVASLIHLLSVYGTAYVLASQLGFNKAKRELFDICNELQESMQVLLNKSATFNGLGITSNRLVTNQF